MIAAAIGIGAAAPNEAPLRALLGADYDGAKVVYLTGRRGKSVAVSDLRTRRSTVLVSFDDDERGFRLSRPYFSPDATQVIVSYDGKCYVLNADGSGKRQILADETVGEASFWDDPKSGERCVVYCRSTKGEKGNKNETCLFRPVTGTTTVLADRFFDAGLSRDGTHLAGKNTTCIKDLVSGVTTQLNVEQTACNVSISPDNTYRVMHLYAPHKFFGIRDEFDRELWRMQSHNFGMPRWSNHPDFCTVDSAGAQVVKISTKETVRIGIGVFLQLWLPSAAGKTFEKSGPIDHLRLERFAEYKKKLAYAGDYSPIIEELSRSDDPEAKLIVAELEEQAESKLVHALVDDDPLCFVPDVRELARRYAKHPIGEQAGRLFESPVFQREIRGGWEYYNLWRLSWFLRPVEGVPQLYTDPVFLEHNRGGLAMMVEAIARARSYCQGTRGMVMMARITDQFALPKRTTRTHNNAITAVAIIAKVSRVPTIQEIAPYNDAVSYIRYHIQNVVNGDHRSRELLAVHYVIRQKKHTQVSEWKPGLKQLIVVDRFDTHPKLQELPAADDADDVRLVPYWALKVVHSW